MRLTFDVESARAVSAAFLAAPAIVTEELRATMGSVTHYLARETQERTPTAAGTLRQSFIAGVTMEGDAVIGTVSTPLPYALPVEMGSKPHFPPMEPLINWVEVKFGLVGDEAEQRARAIQRTIGRYGTEPKRMAHRALRAGAETINAEFAAAAQRISARVVAASKGGAA